MIGAQVDAARERELLAPRPRRGRLGRAGEEGGGEVPEDAGEDLRKGVRGEGGGGGWGGYGRVYHDDGDGEEDPVAGGRMSAEVAEGEGEGPDKSCGSRGICWAIAAAMLAGLHAALTESSLSRYLTVPQVRENTSRPDAGKLQIGLAVLDIKVDLLEHRSSHKSQV